MAEQPQPAAAALEQLHDAWLLVLQPPALARRPRAVCRPATRHGTAAVFLLVLMAALAAAAAPVPAQRPLRIIAMPLLRISPAMDVVGVAATLRERGHDVLVVVASKAQDFVRSAAARHSCNTTAEALQWHALDLAWREFAPAQARSRGEVPPASQFAIPATFPASLFHALTAGADMLTLFQPGVAVVARQLFDNAQLMQRLREFKADAIISVGLSIGSGAGVVHDNTGCLMAHALGVDLIDINGNTLMAGPPTTPQFGTGLTPADLASPGGAAVNMATWSLGKLRALLRDWRPGPTSALRETHGMPWAASQCGLANGLRRLRGVRSRRCEPLLEVLLGSWLVEWPRPLAANQVLVGPGTPRPARRIEPADVAAFVDGAEHGLVLVAFGTVYGPSLRIEDLEELAAAFTSLAPVRVLWPIKASGLPPGVAMDALRLGPNVKAVQWVDYNDVLGHANTRAFATHCGMHSVNEAAFHGVPVVALPFQFEQAEHATKLAVRGAGVISTQAPAYRRGSRVHEAMHFTRAAVAGLVREVLGNASYAHASRRIARALQAYSRARHPYERAADEVELAIAAARLAAAQQQQQQPQQPQQPHSGPATAGGGAEPEARPAAAAGGAQREEL